MPATSRSIAASRSLGLPCVFKPFTLAELDAADLARAVARSSAAVADAAQQRTRRRADRLHDRCSHPLDAPRLPSFSTRTRTSVMRVRNAS